MSEDLPLEHRVIKLELKVDDHANDLKELRDTSKNLSTALQGIEKTLQQIKWIAIGGAIVMFGTEPGVEKVLKTIFGVFHG